MTMMMTPPQQKKTLAQAIRGSGGGASAPKNRTPVTSPDSAKSKAMMSLLDLLCEGQIKGLVNGEQSVIIDGTPLANSDGSKNYSGYTWAFRDGRQDQDVIEGFPDISTPYTLNTPLKNLTPVTFSISNNDADAVRVIITIPSLLSQNSSTGDVTGTSVSYKFSLSSNDGPFLPVMVGGTNSDVVTINDKIGSKYQREHLISLPKPGGKYKVRVTRITGDSTSENLQNDTYVDTYFEIIDQKLTYPNSVMFGLTIDSEQFSSMPSRAYLIDGLYIRIPSNYDPETRTYTGVWDGSFKIGFSNNPAWVLYDILLDKRYGLGGFIKESQVNRAKLYTIGRYCDGLVSNGFGGMEPRFTLNACIQAQADAYKVIGDICSVFRGMSYWSGGMVQVTQDSPADPVYLFTNANVIDGLFNRVGSARKDRHSVVHVQWNDPEDGYKQKIEYVEDAELIKEIGYRRSDTIGFGCTSRAQAHRIGLWILYTEKVESNLTNFAVGLDGLQCMPGDIIKMQDQWRAGEKLSGRLKSATRMGCVLDKPVQLTAGSIIAIRMPDGKQEERQVNQVGLTDTLTFALQLSGVPVKNTVWVISKPGILVPELARCVGVSQGEKPHQFVISVVEHNPSKFASIEQGLRLETFPTTIIDPTFSTPEDLKITEVTYLVAPGQLGSRIDVSWQGKSPSYFVTYRGTKGSEVAGWITETTAKPTFSVYNVEGGTVYDFKVVGQSVTGKLSSELVGTYTALGTLNPPAAPTNLTAVGDFRSVVLHWKNPLAVDLDYVRIYENTVDDVDTAYPLDRTAGEVYTRTGIPGLMKYWYWVKAVNKRGMESDFNSRAGTSAIAGVIAETDLDRDLAKKIEDITEIVDDVNGKIDEALVGTQERINEALARAEAARALASIEEFFRDDADVQIKREQNLMEVRIGEDVAARILEVNEVAVSDRQAVARKFSDMQVKFDGFETGLTEEARSRADADSAFTVVLTEIHAAVEGNHANIITEYEARVAGDQALATYFQAVIAEVKTEFHGALTAQITDERNARVDGQTALAESIQTVVTQVQSNQAANVQQFTNLSNADMALAEQIQAVRATSLQNQALISEESKARADAVMALSEQIGLVNAKTDNYAANFNTRITALADQNQALAEKIDGVQVKSGAYDPFTTWQFDTPGDLEGWVANDATVTVNNGMMRLTPTGPDPYIAINLPEAKRFKGVLYPLVRVQVRRVAGAAWNGSVLYGTANHGFSGDYKNTLPNPALAVGAMTYLEWDMSKLTAGGADWTNSTITQLRLSLGTQADAFDIDWISPGRMAPGGGFAAVQETMKATQDTNGKLSAMWNIKVNLTSNGVYYAAGMGIGIETNGQGIAQSQVVFSADRFMIFNPNVNGSQVLAFNLIDGKVFLNTAIIGNGTITNAMIDNIISSTVLGANGRPVWLLNKMGEMELNGLSDSTRRIMRSTFDRYYDANNIPRIEIGELIN